MVLPLLLSDQNTPVHYEDLGRTVLKCLHVAHSTERALSSFYCAVTHGDLEDSLPPPGSPSQLLSLFDPHVGDCTCQARAQMLWELFAFYSTPENKRILMSAIALLEELRVNAALLLKEIEQSCCKLLNPKLRDLVTHLAIWDRIHFTSFVAFAAHTASRSNVPAPGPPFREPKPERVSRRNRKHRDIAVDTDWNPHDLLALTRFLTMCYLLSERKVATIEAGPTIRSRVRVDFQSMYEKNAQELEALKMMEHAPSYRFKAKDGISGMNQQCEAMQIYVSRVTVDWAKQTATRMGYESLWSRFPEGFVAVNDRRLSCLSSYLSMLLVRAAWVTLDVPIFAVVQHFCSHGGYHNIYCRIVKNPMEGIGVSGGLLHRIGEDDWFKTEILPLDQVISSPWGRTPHVIMIGKSVQGTIEDFRRHLLKSKQERQPPHHDPECCCEIEDCILRIKRTNITRLLAHFFAHHKQFPIPSPGPEEGFHRVATLVRNCLGKEAEDAFREARLGAELFGPRDPARLFTPEHFFLEFPRVLGQDLKEHGEDPRVFGCTSKLDRVKWRHWMLTT